MNIPYYVKICIEKLENAGYSAFLVGGATRDMLMGKTPHDFDITTNAKPNEVISALDVITTIPTGIEHGTITAVVDKNPIEITTYRIDGKYKDNRHPIGVLFTDELSLDLARRDFTVNAMAYSEKNGLIDLYNGQNDIKNKIIRAVGKPSVRFEEDALRILRAFRFMSKLGFTIEDKTLLAIKEKSNLLKNIAKERILAELNGIFDGEFVYSTIEAMLENEVFDNIFETEILLSVETKNILKNIKKECKNLIFALIFDKNIKEILNSLKMSNSQKEEILRLNNIVFSSFFDSDKTDYELRLFLSKNKDLLPLLEQFIEAKYKKNNVFERLKTEAKRDICLSVKELKINGSDILTFGIEPKDVGKTLDFFLNEVLKNPKLNEKERLIETIKKR